MLLECVILLHGLARTDLSMSVVARSLTKEGYHVVNHHYPSRQQNIQKLAEKEIPKALEKCPNDAQTIHFVTHSMGGILLRQYLHGTAIQSIGKVVMLAPPNQGSEIVDKLGKYSFFKLINGPAGMQLGTTKQSVPNSLGAWPDNSGELGIIAGKNSINLFLSSLISGENDGKVSVEKTKLDGMDDHKTMATTHTTMMLNKGVIKQIKTFLQSGKFAD